MKIAVTYEDGNVYQHFGHTTQFLLCTAENGKVLYKEFLAVNGQGHGALAALLESAHVDVLICGGIGSGAQNALQQAGITLFGGVSGNAMQAVDAYLAGVLDYNPNVMCNHHAHDPACGEEKHNCSGNCGK